MSDEKWDEIDREMVDKLRDYIDEEVGASGIHAEFFQIMEDLVLPVLESCIKEDIIDDKHLDQHLKELKQHEENQRDLDLNVLEIKQVLTDIRNRRV